MAEKTVKMSKQEFLDEHKRLIDRLYKADPAELADEAAKQESEVKEYDMENGDLHSNKASHLSAPIDGSVETEFHINKKDIGTPCKVGERYTIEFPVECTSIEGDSERFKQVGKPEIEPEKQEAAEDVNEPEDKPSLSKMPLKDLKKKIQPEY